MGGGGGGGEMKDSSSCLNDYNTPKPISIVVYNSLYTQHKK